MASSMVDIQTRSDTDGAADPKINELNLDVFTIILEELIEEELDDFPHHSSWTYSEPEVAVTLALVCRAWRNIVFSTPSCWRIIKLWMNQPADIMQMRLNRLTDRGRGIPVDLYIVEVHSHYDPEVFCGDDRADDCCCVFGIDEIRLDFTGLPNVRRLFAHFQSSASFSLFRPSALPFLEDVKRAEFDVGGSFERLNHQFNLGAFLFHSPSLVSLDLKWVGMHELPWALTNKALMPNLQTLRVHAGCPNNLENLPRLTRILSHAPNIEELTLGLFDHYTHSTPMPHEFSESVKCFPKLRTICAYGFNVVNWIFTDSGVDVTNLQEFLYRGWALTANHNDVKRFWHTHISIRSVTLNVMNGPDYNFHLSCMPNVEVLTIAILVRNIPWSSPLCTPTVDPITGVSSYLCPNLRVVQISDDNDRISPSSFEDFVRIRCQPVDETGYTVAGCRAIGLLVMDLWTRPTCSSGYEVLSATKAWQEAYVWRVPYGRSALRWMYRPERGLVAIDANAIDADAEEVDDKAITEPEVSQVEEVDDRVIQAKDKPVRISKGFITKIWKRLISICSRL